MSDRDRAVFELSVLKQRDERAVELAFEGAKLCEVDKTADSMLPEMINRFNELKSAGKSADEIMVVMLTEQVANMATLLSEANDRRRELEWRVREIELRPALKYAGVYSAQTRYEPGDLATHAGAGWVCRRETSARPGTSNDWTLAVKSGR